MIVLHESTGTIRIVADRCMKWTCEDCQWVKLGKKTEHLLAIDTPIAYGPTQIPRLDKRASRLKAGYLKAFFHGSSMPMVMADHNLFPDWEQTTPAQALRQMARLVRSDGCKMICFNRKWQYDRVAEHVFLGNAEGMTRLEVEQAIADAGFENMNAGTTKAEDVRRLISHRLAGVDFP